ncbi:MAG TPA: PAS domain S-box protein [Ferruginibacter sp.]|nr:PAS domain S-box protein [Ferruginibacter sp.]
MKTYSYTGVLKYTGAGILLGLMLVLNAYLLNRQHGFDGPWFHIFDYAPDFIIIAFSPIVLGLLFCFIGIRWQQLVAFNTQIKNNLSHEQMMSSMADRQLKLLGKVVAQINEAVIISDNTGCILWANEGFSKITGYSLEEVIGKKGDSFLLGPLSQRSSINNIKLNMYKGASVVEEMMHYRKDGSPYWAMVSVKPIYNESSEIINYIAIETDITIRKEKELALENEIKERKELEAQLVANKNKLEQAIEIAQVGAWEADTVNNGLYISKELRTIYHMPLAGEITLDDIFKNIHPDDMTQMWKSIEGAAKGETNELEYRYIIEGESRHMLSNIAPRFDENANLIGYVGTVKDITHRKLFELAIKKSEEEKAAVLDNAQAIICKHDLEGNILDINPAAVKLSGYSKAELLTMNLQMLVAEEFRQYFGLYLDEIISNKNANGSFQIIRKDGSKRAWLYQNTLYNNNNGEPYIIASAIDITESVKAQNEIEKQQQFISQIIENSPNIIYVMNEQCQVVLHNKTFSQYYLCNASEAPVLDVAVLTKGEKDIFLGDYETMMELQDGEMIRLEGSMPGTDCTNDSESWFNVIKKCFTDKKGKKYILGIGMDITGRYQIETDLIAANEMVERSLKVKDQFISNMSHEIRTPLNAVIGFTDLLNNTKLDKEQGEYVEIIQSASENLLGLINNILDLSKIESGILALENMPVDVKQIVSDAAKILEPKTREKGIQLHCNIANNIPLKVMGDQLRLSQILFNLMGNAIKFTDKGFVEIGCKMVNGPDDSKEYISFYVKDTGIGVAMEKQDAIFERFTQANTDTERLYGGTGLGLNIAKGIVDMYGGTLKMESTPGKGTTFHFILTFSKYEATVSTPATTIEKEKSYRLPEGKTVHVLLAEDNAINAMLAKQVLENGGYTVTHVLNGALAVEAVQKQEFDVVLMDIQMPILNGIAATEKIRTLKGPVSKIPVVAMTAHTLYGEMQNCYKAGMTGYVSKPFKKENLFAAILESIEIQNNNKKLSNTIDDMITYTS